MWKFSESEANQKLQDAANIFSFYLTRMESEKRIPISNTMQLTTTYNELKNFLCQGCKNKKEQISVAEALSYKEVRYMLYDFVAQEHASTTDLERFRNALFDVREVYHQANPDALGILVPSEHQCSKAYEDKINMVSYIHSASQREFAARYLISYITNPHDFEQHLESEKADLLRKMKSLLVDKYNSGEPIAIKRDLYDLDSDYNLLHQLSECFKENSTQSLYPLLNDDYLRHHVYTFLHGQGATEQDMKMIRQCMADMSDILFLERCNRFNDLFYQLQHGQHLWQSIAKDNIEKEFEQPSVNIDTAHLVRRGESLGYF